MKHAKHKLYRVIISVKNFFSLRNDTDIENTINNVKQNIVLKGSNIWYLICSALLASIGLDVNSPAVIIGAMLISPLMGPILGIGLGFGTNDKETMILSLKEFTLAVFISIASSVIYFLISPFGSITTEIVARTKPTILDVCIGFFGGIAGIVAGSRKGIATAIPGVAIATALMPPICTSGFGLATGNFKIFFGAFYLFFINAVFISLSVYLIVKYLRFPVKVYYDEIRRKRVNRIMAFVIVILTVPSIFIFYSIIKEVRENRKIDSFISQKIKSEGRNVIQWRLYKNEKTSNTLKIYLLGEKLSPTKIDSLNKSLEAYEIPNTKLSIQQIDLADDNDYLKQEIMSDVTKTLEITENSSAEKDSTIKKLEEEINRRKNDSLIFISASEELRILYPEIERVEFLNSTIRYDLQKDSLTSPSLAEVNIKAIRNARKLKREENKIYQFLKKRISKDTLIIRID